LLREAGGEDIGDDSVSFAPDGFEAQANWTHLRSPEAYLGHEQGQNFVSPDGVALDEPGTYVAPSRCGSPSGAFRGLDDREPGKRAECR
jgi:hypothetical protein